MKSLKNKIKGNANTVSACIDLNREVKLLAKNPRRVAILSDFTLRGLAECLQVKAFANDIFLSVYSGEYGQWRQEVLNTQLYEYDPEMVFILVDHFALQNDVLFNYTDQVTQDLKNKTTDWFQEFCQTIEHLKSKTNAQIVVGNAVNSYHTPMGIFDLKMSPGHCESVNFFNQKLVDYCRNDSRVFVFDFDGWLGYVGKKSFWYGKYFFMADMRLSPEAFPSLAETLVSFLVPLTGKTKKCLVLDLDNTLWGGVIGEDGLAGIKLSPTGTGQEFFYFQKVILALKKRGVILAINSKNNKADAMEVFQKHPHMLLKETDFSAIKINWENKADNIREIAQELNIGLDSLVFVDDDPTNRELIREILPQVDVLDLPDDPSGYFQSLISYTGFNSFGFTEEDKKRSLLYHEESQRKELARSYTDIVSFLESLGLEATIVPASKQNASRIAQLTQKTNQFNLTTRRYTEEEIEHFIRSNDKIWVLDVKDRFGHYGLTGVCIVRDKADCWEIDTMLLSCRVLGKKIEEQFFGFVLNQLKAHQSRRVIAKYIPTLKNEQVKDFYSKFNFCLIESSIDGDVWQHDLNDYVFRPHNFITIHESKN